MNHHHAAVVAVPGDSEIDRIPLPLQLRGCGGGSGSGGRSSVVHGGAVKVCCGQIGQIVDVVVVVGGRVSDRAHWGGGWNHRIGAAAAPATAAATTAASTNTTAARRGHGDVADGLQGRQAAVVTIVTARIVVVVVAAVILGVTTTVTALHQCRQDRGRTTGRRRGSDSDRGPASGRSTQVDGIIRLRVRGRHQLRERRFFRRRDSGTGGGGAS